jgi:hypothetical protein
VIRNRIHNTSGTRSVAINARTRRTVCDTMSVAAAFMTAEALVPAHAESGSSRDPIWGIDGFRTRDCAKALRCNATRSQPALW